MQPADPNVYKTYATLRLVGKQLDPTDVTQRLDLQPSEAYAPGDRQGQHKPWPYGIWNLNSEDAVTSTHLADHIAWLLDQVEPVADAFAVVCTRAERVDVFCFWMSLTGQGGPTLSPTLLGRLAALNLALSLDIYFAE